MTIYLYTIKNSKLDSVYTFAGKTQLAARIELLEYLRDINSIINLRKPDYASAWRKTLEYFLDNGNLYALRAMNLLLDDMTISYEELEV